jgi:hypothetical protein
MMCSLWGTDWILKYRVIHNSLTHYKKMLHLNDAEDGNMRHTDRKRNSTSLFCIPYKCSIFRPLWCGRRQADNPFPPITPAACRPGHFAIHKHTSRWNRSYHYFMLLFTGGSFLNLARKRRFTVTIDCVRTYPSTLCLLCWRRHFHSACTPVGHRRN